MTFEKLICTLKKTEPTMRLLDADACFCLPAFCTDGGRLTVTLIACAAAVEDGGLRVEPRCCMSIAYPGLRLTFFERFEGSRQKSAFVSARLSPAEVRGAVAAADAILECADRDRLTQEQLNSYNRRLEALSEPEIISIYSERGAMTP